MLAACKTFCELVEDDTICVSKQRRQRLMDAHAAARAAISKAEAR